MNIKLRFYIMKGNYKNKIKVLITTIHKSKYKNYKKVMKKNTKNNKKKLMIFKVKITISMIILIKMSKK